MRKSIASNVKTYVVVLLVLCLGICSCKKPSNNSEPNNSDQPAPGNSKGNDTSTNQDDPGLVPLEIKLPKPHFEGTPSNIEVDNLQPAREGPRPLVYVPVGTTNVALGKPVTSTDPEPILGELEQITDGDKEATDGSYVELDPFKQSITIDLQAEYEIYAIVFWHYHQQARVYFDVIVQVSNDPDFITGVETLFNNDVDNTSGMGTGSDMRYVDTSEGKLVEAKGVRARYVRLYSSGNNSDDMNNYIEVEVYGKPAK